MPPQPAPRANAIPQPRPQPRPALDARAPRSRPDPNPLRLLLGLAGVASAAAVTTAMLPSVSPAQQPASVADQLAATAPQPDLPVRHVTRYVTLKPGETAPPDSTVIVRPQPTPNVTVRIVTRTRQSGKP